MGCGDGSGGGRGGTRRPAGVEAWGNDSHQGALSLALRDVQASGMAPMVRLHHGGCADWALPRLPAVVVCNPLWGQRLLGGDSGEFSNDSSGAYQGSRDEEDGGVDAWWSEEAPAKQQHAARQRAPDRRRAREDEAGRGRVAAPVLVGPVCLPQVSLGCMACLLLALLLAWRRP